MRSSPQAFPAAAAIIAVVLCGGLTAVLSPISGQNRFQEEVERSAAAAAVLETATSTPEAAALRELMRRSAAVGVFPVIKEEVAFFLESATGDGVISARTPDGWSPSAFYLIGSIRYRGTFIKGRRYAVIILFMTRESVPNCERNNIVLDETKNVRAGPIGMLSDGQRAEFADAAIIGFGFYDGKLVPVLPKRKGWSEFTLNDQDGLNKRIYGVKTCDLLAGKNTRNKPAGIDAFRDCLMKDPASAEPRDRE